MSTMSTSGDFDTDDTYAPLGKEVYLSVREEFKRWKTKYEKNVLSSLPTPSEELASFHLPPDLLKPAQLPPDLADRPESYIVVEDFDDDGNVTNTEYVPIESVRPDKFEPHPPYHCYTPAARNRLPIAQDTLSAPFIPYPEDKNFRDLYLDHLSDVQWNAHRDPDAEMIEYETVKQRKWFAVGCEPAVTLVDFMLRNHSSFSAGRDFLPVIWGDGLPSSSKPQLPASFGVDLAHPNDILAEVNLGLAKFCSNLNCLVHNCHVHIDPEWHRINPPYIPKQPRLTCNALYSKEGDPCGEDCFRHLDPSTMDIEVRYDCTFLDSLFKIRPDELPCDLAPICRIPCKQVYLRRCHEIPDHQVFPPIPQPDDAENLNFATPPVCTLARARQTRIVNSFLLVDRTDAELEVGDDGQAAIQLVKLGLKGPVATTSRQGRRRKRPTPRCQNMDIQRGQFKKFDIREGKYGLGAFAPQNIKPGDALGEYVGELVDGGFEPHQMLQKHSGLNYAFGLTGTNETVDSHWYGNATRFLNDSTHGPDPKPRNVTADDKTISKGNELFLEYGDGYWKNQTKT
ncbi:hypothetical protein C8R43DRAFT_952245 [Mycena crocata]|nr:hypothetical protein C8R43DRAFT_952245 [Mycena crocata]